MLVVALLVTSVTMYSLNKSATAVSDETADQVGMVLNTDSSDDSASVESTDTEPAAEETVVEENNDGEDAASNDEGDNAAESDSSFSEASNENDSVNTDAENAENNSDSGNANSDAQDSSSASDESNSGSDEATESNSGSDDATSESTGSSDEATEATSEENTSDSQDDATAGDSTVDTENAEAEETELADGEKVDETDAKAAPAESEAEEKELADGSDIELTEDVVLTVSYVDTEGKAIADEKEISLTDSLDFTTEAPVQEGYTFKEATVDGTVITKITAKQDTDEHRYYEVTLTDDTTLVIKENKTVVLTYVAEVAEEVEGIVLTAAYVDEEGNVIAEESELVIEESLEFAKDAKAVEGYEFEKAAINDSVITKITIKVDEEENKTFEATLEDETTLEIKENTKVVLTYKKSAAEKTEYVYEDEKVKVTATLEKAGAIPAEAELVVTEVNAETEGYDYEAYLKALNNGEESTMTNHNEVNTILYDIAFMMDKTDEEGNVIEGEKVEFQPEEGSVSIKIDFLDNQLEELAQAAGEDVEIKDVEIVHMPLTDEVKETIDTTAEATELKESDINTVAVEAEVNEENSEVELSLDNFSLVGVSFTPVKDQKYLIQRNSRNLTYYLNGQKNAYTTYKAEDGSLYYNDKLALGIAGNFHIVAFDTANLNSKHTNGNILAKTLIPSADFGTNNLPNEISYAQNIEQMASHCFGSKDNHVLALGSEVNVNIHQDGNFAIGNDKINKPLNMVQDEDTSSNPFIDLTAVETEIGEISRSMSLVSTVGVEVEETNSDEQTITYKGDGKAGYLNLTASEWDKMVSGHHLKFVFPDAPQQSDRAIIINIDCSNTTKRYGGYDVANPENAAKVVVDGKDLSTSETTVIEAGRVVYNFYNAEGKKIFLQQITGQVIALGADLEINQGNGNFIAKNVTVMGETHRTDFVGTTTKSGSIEIKGTKTVDGEDVPEEYADGAFTFEIYQRNYYGYYYGYAWDKVGEVNNVGNSVSFDLTDTIDDVGTYYFYLHEKAGSSSNITYDSRYYLAKVEIAEKTGYVGEKTVKVKYVKSVNYAVQDTEPWASFADSTYFHSYNLSEFVFENKSKTAKIKKIWEGGTEYPQIYVYVNATYKKNGTEYNIPDYGKLYSIIPNDDGDWEIDIPITRTTYKTGNGWNSTYEVFYHAYEVDGFIYNNKGERTGVYDLDSLERKIKEELKKNSNKNMPSCFMDTGREVNGYIVSKYESTASTSDGKLLKAGETVTITNKRTTKGNLRIHKMVVNDYGSDFVRDGKEGDTKFGDALLSKVVFRITRMENNNRGNYIVFTGFVGNDGTKKQIAFEYDKESHEIINQKSPYWVVYNGKAQWTVKDLPAGTYAVEEVADGYTFTYDAGTNESTVLESSVNEKGEIIHISRITKYDLTVDDEQNETGNYTADVSDSNWRKLFSVDVNHSDVGPVNVQVGSSDLGNPKNHSQTPTVQVCNYYSIPVGPIEVTKNFIGGTWTENTSFTFDLKAKGYDVYTSDHQNVSLSKQPMPQAAVAGTFEKVDNTEVKLTISGKDEEVVKAQKEGDVVSYVTEKVVKANEDGTYSAVAKFASIPFIYEGTYYYELTEIPGNDTDITYDSNKYYIKIDVSKKHTTFKKSYSYANNKHTIYEYDKTLSGYVSGSGDEAVYTRPDEDFYYLGATVTYATDKDFSNVLAVCDLNLGKNPDTVNLHNNVFFTKYTPESVSVAFNNTKTGKLAVEKVWLKADGTLDETKTAEGSTAELVLKLKRRLEGSTDWEDTNTTIELNKTNNFKTTKEGLQIGCFIEGVYKKYEYCIEEPEGYDSQYIIAYEYKDTSGKTTTSSTLEGPKMISNNGDFGTVKITNKDMFGNVLPSTGGAGELPYMITGAAFAAAGVLGKLKTRKKKEEEDEE